MANPSVYPCSIALQVLTVFSVLAVLVVDVQGGDRCPGFSCGHLRDVRYPFRHLGDPPGCGVEAYELVCSSSKATIYINTGTYYVTGINYTYQIFWVVDANFNANSSCPLPRRNQVPYVSYTANSDLRIDSHGLYDLATSANNWACFTNCSRAITNNNMYKAVTCLSGSNSHVYVWGSPDYCSFRDLQSSCGYLAMIPFGDNWYYYHPQQLSNASYEDIMEFIKKGFTVQFPFDTHIRMGPCSEAIKMCLKDSTSYFKEQISGASILKWAHAFFRSEIHFLRCVSHYRRDGYCKPNWIFFRVQVIVVVYNIIKLLIVLCRFMLPPLAVLIFLAYKYWKG